MQIAGGWIQADHVQTVLQLLENAGHRALLVGGCVRNALLAQPVADIDIATDALPLEVVELAARAGLRVVPTGLDHGTVTVIADGHPHEVTTFRRDVQTDGRHAVVTYSMDYAEDAARRDFTVNALYADRSGAVLDPLGGMQDILARRVRFVGDPARRIAEDYLRILRFFRFHAHVADPDAGLDADGLAACAMLSAGIDTVSKERVGEEMRKLLAARDPGPSIAAMQATGILGRVLPGADATALPVLVHLEAGMAPDPIRRMAVLGGADAAGALRLSRHEARQLDDLRGAALGGAGPGEVGYRFGAALGEDAGVVRAALLGHPVPPDWRASVARGAQSCFPVTASDLMPGLSGRALGARLKEMEQVWIASGFRATREELLG